ncbi:MAG: bifunctional diaminohydroxyphosphoribosylaminopyrimidine deaminase/5-amino-6-(5-phosphoribosylamino)uracil reductase RibD [Hyphomicrobiaceae bacterium]|nr:bifunctional diaminohydroxyphosphoribosylaminopyrimidine deaminase/5-amino-6-(5-phosphoribosylamino)uracil reductase RibD [Hyphomicrobiaceae bacterium]
MMAIAVRMARRGLGTTAPNPSVGAVIVDEATGEVISRGWTQPGGRPHAEKEALRRAGERARGKTMYVTLEPCAHTGRVPTCADAMVASGLKRVVCAIPDPNPIVSGRGFAQLRSAGIEVDVGYLADEARWVTLGHILRQTEERPFVQLKMALDMRGRVAAGDGAPVWVTGPEARAYAHLLRARADAILVGAGTVIADDPELTCRLPGLDHRSPDRIVLDTRLRTPPTAKVYRQGATRPRVWVAAALDTVEEGVDIAHGGAMVLDAAAFDGGGLDMEALLASLAGNGLTRLLVEGGPSVWHAFLAAGLVDEACVIVGASAVGGGSMPVVTGDRDAYFARYNLLAVPSRSRGLGADRLHVYRRESP